MGQTITLNIIGENEFHTRVIDSLGYKSSFLDYNSLETEVLSLKEQLFKIGFIDTVIKDISKVNDTIIEAHLNLGERLKRIKVFYDNTFDITLLDFIDIKRDSVFFELEITHLESSLRTLNTRIAEQGDPFSTLQLNDISKLDSSTLSAQLKIVTNQKRRIDNIVVKGYEKFPKSYISHFLKLRTGDSFNLNAIKNQVELLDNLRFASKIKDPEVLFTKDSTTLYLYIEKNRINNFDGFLGFGTNENTNKIEFDGYLDLRLINNLNFGESINLFYKSDEIDQQTFRVNADLPYLFRSPIGVNLGLHIFRKDSTFVNVSQEARINYQINANHKIGVGINGITSTNLLDNDTVELNDYSASFYLINYNVILPQYGDPLFPINFWFDITSSYGRRTNDSGKTEQQLFNLDTYKIFNLNNRNSIFTKLSGGLLISDDYLDNELFRFGGINSIRGFEENSLVGNLFGVINTEYRYRLSNSIYVHSVLDAAYTENQLLDSKSKLFGFGFGFGLLTNAGLFRFNYSSGKTEGQQFRLSDSKIHISLTATF